MLSTELPTITALVGLVWLGALTVLVLYVAHESDKATKRAKNWCNDVGEIVNQLLEQVGESAQLDRIAKLETVATELTDSYDALLTSHKKLRSRIGMREVRERRKEGGEDDMGTTTDKKALRLAAKSKGLI